MSIVLWIIYLIIMIRPISYGYYEGKRNNYAGMTVVWVLILISAVFMRKLAGM